jgi:hypothetical protein
VDRYSWWHLGGVMVGVIKKYDVFLFLIVASLGAIFAYLLWADSREKPNFDPFLIDMSSVDSSALQKYQECYEFSVKATDIELKLCQLKASKLWFGSKREDSVCLLRQSKYIDTACNPMLSSKKSR